MQESASRPRTVVLLASLGAATVTCAAQGLAPALPAIQRALDLSDAQVALLTTAYLLPGVLFGIPLGALTERIGRRLMFVGSMSIFGIGGVVQLLAHSLPTILTVRAVQGACTGAIVALTITMIGDVLRDNAAQATGQGLRVVAMTAGEAIFPVLSGMLVTVTWFAPFGIQILGLLLAVVGWFACPRDRYRHTATPRVHWRALRDTLAGRGALALQLLAFMRFFFKFAVITYYPILAVHGRGMSAVTLGAVLGLSALFGSLGALSAGRLFRRVSTTRVVGGCLASIGLAFAAIAAIPVTPALVTGVLVYGLADGLYSVSINVLVTEASPPDARAFFVAFTGTVRNLGKLVAPVAFGLLTLVLPMTGVFAVWATTGLAAVFAARRLDAPPSAPVEPPVGGDWTP